MVGDGSLGFSEADRAELIGLARRLSDLFIAVRLLANEAAGGEGLVARLEAHLGTDPRALPVISQELPSSQLVDVQIALDTWASLGVDRDVSVVGISGDQRRFHPLSEVLSVGHLAGIALGPVDYVDLADSADTTRRCVRFGLFLVHDGMRSAGVLLRGPDPHGPVQSAMVEVVSSNPDFGQEVLGELRQLAVERSVLRGAVLGLGEGDGQHYGALRFMHRPSMRRDELVLPDANSLADALDSRP